MIEIDQSLYGRKTNQEKKSIKVLFTIPSGVRGTIISNWWVAFCFGYVLYFLMTWLPGYLTLQRGLSIQSMGLSLMFPWIAAAFGIAFGGNCQMGCLKNRQ
ncbi:hypothetical protein ACI2OX_17050 [Bacillus sp. N9]